MIPPKKQLIHLKVGSPGQADTARPGTVYIMPLFKPLLWPTSCDHCTTFCVSSIKCLVPSTNKSKVE